MSDPVETPQVPAPAPTPKAGRWLKIALAVSLSVNLLVVGLVAGAALSVGKREDAGGPGLRTLGLGPFAMALEREDRAALQGRIDGREMRRNRVELGQSLRAFQAALATEPFDRGAAEAALSGARGAGQALQATGHRALLDQLEAMSAEERQNLADRMERALRRMGRGAPEGRP